MFFNNKKGNKNENFEPLASTYGSTMKRSFEIPSCLFVFQQKGFKGFIIVFEMVLLFFSCDAMQMQVLKVSKHFKTLAESKKRQTERNFIKNMFATYHSSP